MDHFGGITLETYSLFKEVPKCNVGSGQSVLLWEDDGNGQPLVHPYPELHSFAIRNNTSLADMATYQDFSQHLHLQISTYFSLTENIP